jgi:hypothetical protein
VRTFLLAGFLCLMALPAPVAKAQDQLLIVDAPELPQTVSIGREPLVIGSGALIGATAGYLLPFRFATLLGAVTGGVAAHWWYNRADDDYQPLLRRNGD